MEEQIQKYWLYNVTTDILGQTIIYLVIKLSQIFIILNKESRIQILFNKSYEFNSS